MATDMHSFLIARSNTSQSLTLPHLNVTQVTHSVMKPIKKLFWRTMQRIIKRQFDLRGDMVPPVTLPEDLFYGGQILDNVGDGPHLNCCDAMPHVWPWLGFVRAHT